MSEETVREKIKKTGNTPYQFDELEITMDPDIFLPVVALNQLRREALEQLMAAETAKDRREAPAPVSYQTFTAGVREEAAEYESGNAPYLAVSVEQNRRLRRHCLRTSSGGSTLTAECCFRRKTGKHCSVR